MMLCEEIEEEEPCDKEEIHDLPNNIVFDESETATGSEFQNLTPPIKDKDIGLHEDDKQPVLKNPNPFKIFGRRVKISEFDSGVMEKLWRTGELGINNPKALLLTIWYFLTKRFGIKGRNEHCKLKLKNFSINTDESGKRSLAYYIKPNQKSKELPEVCDSRERCPVTIFEHYLLKRPIVARNSNSSLYLKPIPEWNNSTENNFWFTSAPLGKNKIGGMINSALKRLNPGSNKVADNHHLSGSLTQLKIFNKCESNRMNFLIAQATRRLSNKTAQLKKKAFGKKHARFKNIKILRVTKIENHDTVIPKVEPLINCVDTKVDPKVDPDTTVLANTIVGTARISQPAPPCPNNSSFRKILPRASCISPTKSNISPTYSLKNTNFDTIISSTQLTSVISKATFSSTGTRSPSKRNFQLPKTSHASSKVTTLLANRLKAKQDVGSRLSSSSESSQYSILSSPPFKRKGSNDETPKHAYNTRSSSKRNKNDSSIEISKYYNSDSDSSSQPKDPQENVVNLIEDDDELPKIQRVESMSPVKQNVPQTIDVASLSQAILSSINNGMLKFVTSGNGTSSQSQVPITLKVVVQPNGTLIDQNGALRLENTVTCTPTGAPVQQNEHIDLTSEESSNPTVSRTSYSSGTNQFVVSTTSNQQESSMSENGESERSRFELNQTNENRNSGDELMDLIELISLREKITIPDYIRVGLVSDVLWQTGALSVKGPWFVIFSLWWMTHYYFGITDQENQAKLQWGHFKLIKTREDELTSASTCLTFVGPLNYITSTEKSVCKFIYPDSSHNYINEGVNFIDIYKHYVDKRPTNSFNDDSPFYLQSCVKGPKEVVANHDVWYENVQLSQSKIGALMRNMVQKIVRPNMHVVKNLSKHFPNILLPRVVLSNINGSSSSVSTSDATPQVIINSPIQMAVPSNVIPTGALAAAVQQQQQPQHIANYGNQPSQQNIPSLVNAQNNGSSVPLSSLNAVSSMTRLLPQHLIMNSSTTVQAAGSLAGRVTAAPTITPQFATTTPTVAAQPICTASSSSHQNVSTPQLAHTLPIQHQPVHQPTLTQPSPTTTTTTNQYSNLNEVIAQMVNQRLSPQNTQAKLTTNPPIQVIQKPGESPTQTMQSLMVAVQQHAAQNNKVVQLFQLPPGTKLINPANQINATPSTTQNTPTPNNLTPSTQSQPQQNLATPPAGPAITKVVSLHKRKMPSSQRSPSAAVNQVDSAPNQAKYVADIEHPQPSPDQLKTFSQVIDESLHCQDENFMEYIEKLWWYKLLGCDNPWSLNFTLWFINVMAFGIESRAEHLRLTIGDFKFCSLPDGRKYIYHYHKTNHRSYYLLESPADEPKFKCPIHLFNQHRKVRPPGTLKNSDRFYLQPRVVNSKLTPVWFTEIGWGKNKLGSLMQDAANLAKIPISWLRKSRLKNVYYKPCPPSKVSDSSSAALDSHLALSSQGQDDAVYNNISSILAGNCSSNLVNIFPRQSTPSNSKSLENNEVVCISDDEEDIKPDVNLLANDGGDTHPNAFSDSNSAPFNSQEEYENSISPANSNSETDKSRKRKNYRPMRFSD